MTELPDKETEPVDDDTISLARRVRALEDAAGAVIPRWDEDPLVLAQGWVGGRCGKCGESLPAPVSAPVSTEDTDLRSEFLAQPGDSEVERLTKAYSALTYLGEQWITQRDEARVDAAKWAQVAQDEIDRSTRLNETFVATVAKVEQERDQWRDGHDYLARAVLGADAEPGKLSGLERTNRALDRIAELHAEVEQLRGDLKKAHTYIGERLIAGFAAAPVSSVEPEQGDVLGFEVRVDESMPPDVIRFEGADGEVASEIHVKQPAVPEQAQPRPCRHTEGATGIDCDLPEGHDGPHDGKWIDQQHEGNWLQIQWPANPDAEVVEAPAGQDG